MVVSAHPAASKAGLQVLEAGGNAMDAAVATAFALSVVEPFSSGVGGGGFLLYYDAQRGTTTVVDFREVAPRKARPDTFVVDGKADPKLSTRGYKAVAVPGMVPGLAKALRRFGTKRLRDVVRPAIELADKGFPVSPQLFVATHARLKDLRADAEAKRVFLKDGEPYPVGERFRQPDLARTLRALGQLGPDLFTTGAVGRAMVAASKAHGGLLSIEDLKRFEPRFGQPLAGKYRGYTVLTMPPPSSGGALLLQMLDLYAMSEGQLGAGLKALPPPVTPPSNVGEPSIALMKQANDAHLWIEIMRRAFADRAMFFGDPAFVDVPIDGLLDPGYLKTRLATIDMDRASPSSQIGAGEPNGLKAPVMRRTELPKESSDTTHLVAIDRRGNVVTLTQTINTVFGAAVVAPETGVMLNNEMDDFSAAPGTPNAFGLVGAKANEIQPGKVPLSSMTPTLLLKDGRVRLAVGAPGGPTIITTVLQIIHGVVDLKLDLPHAVARPRMHMQWLPDRIRIEEDTLSDELRATLEARGHIFEVSRPWGNATAIQVLADGTRIGVADPRGGGGGEAE
ncbi:MAG: gamma-glutamyltransferase family protein [Deltaproteobacteria bacterium]|nr:gamma-glutamyltransferase family protein [Deltaproteobacteria bacterium]